MIKAAFQFEGYRPDRDSSRALVSAMRRTIGSTGISVQHVPERTIPGAARDDQHQSDDIGDFFSPERNRGERPDEEGRGSHDNPDPSFLLLNIPVPDQSTPHARLAFLEHLQASRSVSQQFWCRETNLPNLNERCLNMNTESLKLFHTNTDEAYRLPVRVVPLVQERHEERRRLLLQNLWVTSGRRECVTA